MKEKTLSSEREEIKKVCLKNFKDFKRGNFVELFEAIEEQDKEFIKKLKEKYPCVKKIKKCRKRDLNSGGSWYVCTNCRFRFKIDEIFGEELVK